MDRDHASNNDTSLAMLQDDALQVLTVIAIHISVGTTFFRHVSSADKPELQMRTYKEAINPACEQLPAPKPLLFRLQYFMPLS
jgi:hypothetical protein